MSMTGPQSGEQFLKSVAKRLQRVEMRSPSVSPVPLAGTTVNRPDVTLLPPGLMFFDTDLGHPIWASSTGWVDATGAAVL